MCSLYENEKEGPSRRVEAIGRVLCCERTTVVREVVAYVHVTCLLGASDSMTTGNALQMCFGLWAAGDTDSPR
jgi:hypothetical protein